MVPSVTLSLVKTLTPILSDKPKSLALELSRLTVSASLALVPT